MKRTQIKKALTGCAVAAVVAAFASQVQAMDELDAWSSVSATDLGSERGQGATNLALQNVEEQIVEGDSIAGNINLGLETFDGQAMSINAFNSGNNVVMQNQMAVEVNFYESINIYNGGLP